MEDVGLEAEEGLREEEREDVEGIRGEKEDRGVVGEGEEGPAGSDLNGGLRRLGRKEGEEAGRRCMKGVAWANGKVGETGRRAGRAGGRAGGLGAEQVEGRRIRSYSRCCS